MNEEQIAQQCNIFFDLHPRFIRSGLNQALILGFLRTHHLNPDATTLSFAYASLEKELDLKPEAPPAVSAPRPARTSSQRPRLSSRPQSEPTPPQPIEVSKESDAFAQTVVAILGRGSSR